MRDNRQRNRRPSRQRRSTAPHGESEEAGRSQLDRTDAPVCRYSIACGGCTQIHVPYRDQLASKALQVVNAIGDAIGITLEHSSDLVLPVAYDGAFPLHLRHKVSFAFDADRTSGRLLMGHYAPGSRRLVNVDDCPVHSRRGNEIAFALYEHLAAAGVSAAGPRLDGILRHVVVRTTTTSRDAVALLVVTRNDKALRKPIRTFLDSDQRPDGFFLNVNSVPGPYMVGKNSIRIAGQPSVLETVGDVSFQVSPTAFFQTNPYAASALQQYVVGAAAGASRVLDLYCGSGLFSLPLAAAGARVTGVEENREAVKGAVANARLNQLPLSRLTFLPGRVEDTLHALEREPWDTVILDPPRQGCSDEVLETIFQRIRPPRAIYVSCNLAALAAELSGIVQCGYRLTAVKAVDMFPHTDHLETVVTLGRDQQR